MVVISNVPNMVFAEAHDRTAVVKRSALVRDTDEVYAEAAKFLEAHGAVLLRRADVHNVRYMSCSADTAVYALGVAA